MHHALAGSQPLHIAAPETRLRAQRIGMVNQPLAHNRHGCKTPVRVRRKTRHRAAVVHAPAVLAAEVLPDVAPGQRRRRAHLRVGFGVGVVVVDAKQERVNGFPRKAERLDLQDGRCGQAVSHGGAFKNKPLRLACFVFKRSRHAQAG